METTVIRRPEDLDRLAPSWGSLDGAFPMPTMRPAWLAASAEAFASRYDLHLVVLGDPEEPEAVAPLGRRAGAYELLGARELYEPADMLYRDTAAAGSLARELARSGLPLRVTRLIDESPFAAAAGPAYGRALRRDGGGVPTIALDRDADALLSSRKRQDLRRAARKAAELGDVSLEIHAPTPATLDPLLEEAFDVELRSWKGEAGSAVAQDTLREPFYRAYARRSAAEGTLRIAFLRIDGRAIAMQYASESDDRFWLFKIAFDREFARVSPGQLLLLHTLRHAGSAGLRSYEFLGSEAEWTRQWTTETRQCCSLRTFPIAPGTLPALLVDGARLVAGRLRR